MTSSSFERGIQAVPRGLSAGLTSYLNSLDSVVRRLAGLARGSDSSQAVRRSEAASLGGSAQTAVTTAKIVDGAITASKLADSAVTADKIADASIIGGKLRIGAITDRELAAQCVGKEELKPRSVSADKLAADVLPVSLEGAAAHGETVDLGPWLERPNVAVTGFALNVQPGGILRTGIENLRLDGDSWLFDAVACCDMGEDENGAQRVVQGQMTWNATGRRADNE